MQIKIKCIDQDVKDRNLRANEYSSKELTGIFRQDPTDG